MELTQIIDVPVENLRRAPWNYKTDGTPEEIADLAKSVRRDGSAGVFCVRELEPGIYEVFDGNHRLQAIRLLGWSTVRCELFDEISYAEAITVTRRRNHDYFGSNDAKLAALYRDVVIPEIPLEELDGFMPDKADAIMDLIELYAPDIGEPIEPGTADTGIKEEYVTLEFTVPTAVRDMWELWKTRVNRDLGYDSEWKAFEFALVEAVNTPEG